MGKIKTSRRQKIFASRPRKSHKKKDKSFEISLRDDAGIAEFNPTATLLDTKLIGAAIVQCLIENHPDEIIEIIEEHINCLNKSKFLEDAAIPRSTMYRLLKKKNPTIRTLAKLMHAAHQAAKQ